MQGEWFKRIETRTVGDSTLESHTLRRDPYNHMHEILPAEVILPETEPFYRGVTVKVETVNGFRKGQVAWPGPCVTAGKSGTTDGSRFGIHGFYQGPLPGQQVMVGFSRGKLNAPVVLNGYSYRINQLPSLEGLHTQPLTTSGFGARDVFMSSYLGSYIVISGGVPLPGRIKMRSEANVLIDALAGIELQSSSGVTLGPSIVLIGPSVTREPAMLGTKTSNFLDTLLTEISNITVTVSGVPYPIDNKAVFLALKGQLSTLTSTSVQIG